MREKKKILVIMPKYFGYENHIRDALEKYFDVTMIYENMDEVCYIYRFVYVYVYKYKDILMTRFYKNRIKQSFDVVFVVRGASLTRDVMEYLKETSPEAKFYMYQWDSVVNNKRALEIEGYFDKISTFDMEDANKYNWFYRPLFYISKSNRNGNRQYDMCYICSLHTQRVKVYNELLRYRNSTFLHLYAPWTHFIKQKYIKRSEEFRDLNSKEIKIHSIGLEDTQVVYSKSDIIVDYTRNSQDGFTMRTIESIGHKCKLLTNNRKVMDSDFYNENNVYIYDIENFSIPEDFIKKEYVELDDEVYEKYSLRKWLKETIDL